MFLGIEIGGTKIQLGVGLGDGSPPAELVRCGVAPDRGAAGILEQIDKAAAVLIRKHRVTRIGIGFGGPVDTSRGCVVKSHQIAGWDDFPLVAWCERTLGFPTVIDNDCNVGSLAEARFGAGAPASIVFYVTVGTGVGGGLVLDGRIHGSDRPAVAEIGHLRPGLLADRPDATVESLASGWGIVAAAQSRLSGQVSCPLSSLRREDKPAAGPEEMRQRLVDIEQADEEYAADLLERCDGDSDRLTAKTIAQAASEGNAIALDLIGHACQALGWAIGQVITLTAPQVVVVGGGVSLIGEQLFFAPLRAQIDRYVFPPLADSCKIVPAELGELVVVHGALALARGTERLGMTE